MKVFDADLPDTRPMILKLAEQKAGQIQKNRYEAPATLGRPQKGMAGYSEVMAMDECFRNVLSRALRSQIQYSAFPLFVGYGMLSNLAQEALIRAGVETIADEMTRKNVQLYYDEDGKDKEKLINDINSDMVKFKIRERMNEAMLKDGYFGGCLVYIDVGDLEDDEKEEPLILDKKTFKAGSFRGLKVIEPVNICPGTYNTTDPTDEHYFNPEFWYILGKRYHASRFLYIASNETPLLLKPAYNFFGIPQAQLALDYVAHFVANRESAQELLNKFSLTCFGTDMSQGLQQNGSWADLINRMKMFNKMKTNNGTFVYNKETEELSQINTPLSGVRDIVEMSLNLLTAVWRIPKIKYIGEGEGGLNASSKEQMRSYYDYIGAMQEKVLTNPYTTILKIIQLNKGLEPDEKLLFKFPVLWDMDDQERAALNKQQADRDAIYLANGVLSQEEVRQRLSLDRNSEYTMIDVDDLPEAEAQPLEHAEEEEQNEEDRQAMDMAFDGRWITIGAREKGENGEDDEGRKGRHIYLDDGETPEEAIKDLEKKGKKKVENKEKTDKDDTESNENLKDSVKEWYKKTFEDDELGDRINEKVSFEEIKNNPKKVYDLLDVSDSLVKERVFLEISERTGKDYDDIYQEWMGNKKEDAIGYSKRFKEAKTLKEAEENAKMFMREGGVVKFSNKTRVENANVMNKTIAELVDKYGLTYKLKTYGDNSKIKTSYAHANGGMIEGSSKNLMSIDANGIEGIYDMSVGNYIEVRKKRIERYKKELEEVDKSQSQFKYASRFQKEWYSKRLKETEKELKYSRFNVFTSPENTIRDIFTHEFGHTIYYDRMRKEREEAGKTKENYFGREIERFKMSETETKSFKLARDGLMRARKDGFIFKVSAYANTNKEEFFAECFAMREAGEKVPDYIEKMLDEVTK